MRKVALPFKPRARLLLELGKHLIKDESIALFELVKNSYDADAAKVDIVLKNIDSPEIGEIQISDDGSGMDWKTVTNVWLEPGTDFREKQVLNHKKTKKYNRTPMGQKGVGRFGAHKLGRKILLITKSKGNNEIVVEIDWKDFEKKRYLDEVPVNVYERSPEYFTEGKTGTFIKITGLWDVWSRGMVRSTYRAVNSICSPFNSPDSFKALFRLDDEDKKDWLEGLMNWNEAIKSKLYKVTCFIEKNLLSYQYEFEPWKTMTRVEKRKVNVKSIKMEDEKHNTIDLGKYSIGPVRMDLYIYDLDPNILSLGINDKRGLREFLKFNGGIRVYRNGIRVYDYGEPGNDWLLLGERRINVPTARLSNNLVIGAVSIKREKSTDLIEKTNREGFIENEAVKAFREAVTFALLQIEAERNKDKTRLRVAYSQTTYKEPVIDAIYDLRDKFKKKGLLEEFGVYLDRIEKDYKDIREKLLTSAGAGLNLSIVIHEIEKIIKELVLASDKHGTEDKIKNLVKRLSELVEGYSALVRISGPAKIRASALIEQALFNVSYRLSVHKIEVINGSNKENDFEVKCSKRLILGAIMNIIDNSIWWIENRKPSKKLIYISPVKNFQKGNAIVIADNGPGFMDTLEDVITPFFTRKPDGMGLGLHITNEIMKAHNGRFTILEKGEVEIPKNVDGAIVVLVFPED